MIIGLLLGDLCLRKFSSKGGTFLLFEQGGKNIDYGWHLYSLFKEYIYKTPEVRSRFDKRTQKTYNSLQFFTRTSSIFNEFYFIFYDSITKKKKIPINIDNFLTARSLAYWICDDGGCINNNGVIQGIELCTDSFTYDEIIRIFFKKKI